MSLKEVSLKVPLKLQLLMSKSLLSWWHYAYLWEGFPCSQCRRKLMFQLRLLNLMSLEKFKSLPLISFSLHTLKTRSAWPSIFFAFCTYLVFPLVILYLFSFRIVHVLNFPPTDLMPITFLVLRFEPHGMQPWLPSKKIWRIKNSIPQFVSR